MERRVNNTERRLEHTDRVLAEFGRKIAAVEARETVREQASLIGLQFPGIDFASQETVREENIRPAGGLNAQARKYS